MALQKNKSLRNIYLADDDDDDRTLFVEALQEVDSTAVLTQAEDGKQLLEILHGDPDPLPEVIFLDINMPKVGGFECLEQIKQHTNLKKLPIIMLSTSSDPVTIDKALELGATVYAVKPSSFDGLKTLIKNVLQMDWISIQQNKKRTRLE
ncbi:MAG: response regulator [Flavobacterium circumlabens]|uniref:Response regulator n=1 Tax=Flavobacterium circumlabens TaxID=2133765 RepID=A0A4Y7UFZ9_9FLAO|nr:response regulator [Flavobacterium circumlabens]TCN60053.1 response regulator receiver domain-containing protein [Flavobacterium circumlabens]TEB45286.1 response regulator [Flavobacterium circumlabens]